MTDAFAYEVPRPTSDAEPWGQYVARFRRAVPNALKAPRPVPYPRRPDLRVVRSEQPDLEAVARYDAWRKTDESRVVLRVMAKLALHWIRNHGPDYAIGGRKLWDRAKDYHGIELDNRLQALACRELEQSVAELRGRFRFRPLGRKAS